MITSQSQFSPTTRPLAISWLSSTEIARGTSYQTHLKFLRKLCIRLDAIIFYQLWKMDDETDALNEEPLEPIEFCKKWVESVAPGERGYYKACVKSLAYATGLSERTIEGWGSDFSGRPDSVLVTLEKENTLNEIRKLVNKDQPHH